MIDINVMRRRPWHTRGVNGVAIMSIKDILVHLAEPGLDSPALHLAVTLAQRHGAHVTGLYAYSLDWPLLASSGGYMDPATIQLIIQESQRAALKKATLLRAPFEEVLRREAISGEWRQVEGNVEAIVTLHSRYADLTIFGRAAEDSTVTELAETVLFASGRPILLMPPNLPPHFAPDRILVGWNGSREAARAIGDAMPLLRSAKAVRVLSVQPEYGPDALVQAEDMSRHLARHDVPVSAATATLDGLQTQDLLLNAASDFGADLLVIGGYGHGQLREMVLGGVTRTLFRHAAIPVLMSH
jgi:nucleotide-binding universal stress UspA family protein